MYFTHSMKEENLTVALFGEMDHHGAKEQRTAVDLIIEENFPKTFFLDLKNISFCDSSGLGFIMGRVKKCASVGCEMILKNPSDSVLRLLKTVNPEWAKKAVFDRECEEKRRKEKI